MINTKRASQRVFFLVVQAPPFVVASRSSSEAILIIIEPAVGDQKIAKGCGCRGRLGGRMVGKSRCIWATSPHHPATPFFLFHMGRLLQKL